jgi:hypothetical protein
MSGCLLECGIENCIQVLVLSVGLRALLHMPNRVHIHISVSLHVHILFMVVFIVMIMLQRCQKVVTIPPVLVVV